MIRITDRRQGRTLYTGEAEDLVGADLADQDLTGADLTHAVLEQAVLTDRSQRFAAGARRRGSGT